MPDVRGPVDPDGVLVPRVQTFGAVVLLPPTDAPRTHLHKLLENVHPPTSFAIAYGPARRRACPPRTCTPGGEKPYDTEGRRSAERTRERGRRTRREGGWARAQWVAMQAGARLGSWGADMRTRAWIKAVQERGHSLLLMPLRIKGNGCLDTISLLG